MPRKRQPSLREVVEKDNKLSWYAHIVSDQGNGGASCGKCNQWLSSSALHLPGVCPNCKRKLVEVGDIYTGGGGSDF